MAKDLIRDILDKQLVDRNQRKMGKVDGLVIELNPDRAPTLKYIELGALTRARRVSSRLARWIKTEPYRIPWDKVRDIGVDIEVDVDAEKTPALRVERFLREKIVKRM